MARWFKNPPFQFFLERDEDKLTRAKNSLKYLRLVDRGYLSTLTFYSVLEEQEGISAEPVYKWFINELGNKPYSIENEGISLLIPTINRPENVNRLLGTLKNFGYMERSNFKPVIVDSSKDSSTKQVALAYPVEYLSAEGLGKSKAMNLAIDNLSTKYIAFLDDDIVMINSNWLDILMSNFVRDDIAYVSGRVVAAETKTKAQDKWESKGALNKGPKRIEVGKQFFNKFRFQGVPVNLVTMGANHIIKRDVLNEVGAHDERFGPGEPIGGAGADLDLTYKVLKYGYTVIYDPTSVVAHHHPDSLEELKSKLFVYGISDTAIHTKFLMEFRDVRSLFQLVYRPAQNTGRMLKSLVGKYPLPANILLAGIAGNLIGTVEYFKHKDYPKRTSYK